MLLSTPPRKRVKLGGGGRGAPPSLKDRFGMMCRTPSPCEEEGKENTLILDLGTTCEEKEEDEDSQHRRTLVDTTLLSIIFDQRGLGRFEFSYRDIEYVTSLPFTPDLDNPTDLHLVRLLREAWDKELEDRLDGDTFVYGSFIWMRDNIRMLGEQSKSFHRGMGMRDPAWLPFRFKVSIYRAIWKDLVKKMLDIAFLPILFRLYLRHLLQVEFVHSRKFSAWIDITYKTQEECGISWPNVQYDAKFNRGCIPFFLSYAAMKRTCPITMDHVKLCMDTLGL